MKIKNKKLIYSVLILLALTLGFSIGFFSPTIDNDSESNTRPNASAGEITIVTPENKTYTEPNSGYFPATYGFENDLDGTIPDKWEEFKGDPSMTNEIIAELDGHKKVLHMDKGNTYGDNNNMNQNFTSVQNYGVIEFWGRTTDTSQESAWHLKSGTINQYSIAGVRIMDSGFQFKNSSEWYSVPFTANIDQWYHIKIQFECGTGNHYGLAQYKWRFFVNGVQFGDYQMILSHSNVSHIIIHQNWRYDNFHMYTDAIGYSWDPDYDIGDNLNEGLLLSYDNTSILDWKGYSLDGQTNKTILGNATIPMPSDGQHRIQLFGNDSIGTMYGSNLRHFTVNTNPYLNIITPENKTYFGPNAGFYPATFGFENDKAGENPDFFAVDETGGYIDVIDEVDGHDNVVGLFDDANTGDWPYFYNTFDTPQTYGTYEYWVRTNYADFQGLRLYSGSIIDSNVIIDLVITADKFRYYDGSWHDILECDVNRWYHIEIAFECTTGGYRGLSQYKFKVWIDGTEYGEYGWWHNKASADSIQFMGGGSISIANNLYVDAIGYSWDPNYNIGDNLNEGLLLSYENSTNLDWQGYSLNGQANRTILGNTTISMPSEGTHQIQIFGNNSLGSMFESAVRYFSVDTIPPEISVTYPSAAQEFSTPPSYILSITEDNIAAMWYTLNGGSNILFSSETGTIDSTAWNSLADGPVTIRFYVRDIADREVFEELIVVKIAGDVPTPPPGIPGYNLIALIGVTVVISTILIRKRLKS